MRLSKSEYGPMTLALDTGITVLEADVALPTGVKKSEVNHALIMMRAMRSRLLRSASEPTQPEGDKTT